MGDLPGDELFGGGVSEVGEDGGVEEFGDKEVELGVVEGLDVFGRHEEGGIHGFCVGSGDAGDGVGVGC